MGKRLVTCKRLVLMKGLLTFNGISWNFYFRFRFRLVSDCESSSHRGSQCSGCHRSRRLVCQWVFVRIGEGIISRGMLQSWFMQWWNCYSLSRRWGLTWELAMDVQADADQGPPSSGHPTVIFLPDKWFFFFDSMAIFSKQEQMWLHFGGWLV